MKLLTLISSFLVTVSLQAQTSFKTIVPQEPVIEGEAFQVQYVLTGAERTTTIRTPVFPGFRLASGPNIHIGSTGTAGNTQLVQNFVYTLEPLRPGRFVIPAAIIAYNNKYFQSDEVVIQVITAAEAASVLRREEQFSRSDYYLRPGEDPYRKINDNLFVKVLVDRNTCFVGEPVQATFKLYSRLESRSDIIKNPGFYGFTAHDMAGFGDKQVSIEKVNGNLFDVHTIRKVQLYALQAGDFTIDPMEIKHSVEFSRSRVNRKTEQRIAEGMIAEDAPGSATEGTEVFESYTRTSPVRVHVKPLPARNKPANYSGAVGHFAVRTKLLKPGLVRNEEGFFEITISGKGNFTQLDAPKPRWPAGIEGFDPVVTDVLDRSHIPLAGSRTFRYPFVSSVAGSYKIPPVSFSFFDTDSNNYKTIISDALALTVANEERLTKPVVEERSSRITEDAHAAWIGAAIAIGLVLIVILYWVFFKKEKEPALILPLVRKQLSIEELLQPVQMAGDDNAFYAALRKAAWSFLSARFELSGSGMNKQLVQRRMKERGLGDESVNKMLQLLDHCDAGIFTKAELGNNREMMITGTQRLFEEIDNGLL
jgi:BatD DUF11 like domain